MDHIVQNHVPEFPNLLFTSHLRPEIKKAEIVDGLSENQTCHPNMEKRKRILSEALESHFTPDPVSAAVCCGNCTVIDFMWLFSGG